MNENIPEYKVEQSYCIGCTKCYKLASDNFESDLTSKGGMRSKLAKQPETEDEAWLCNESFNDCPTGAISKVVDGVELFNQ